MKSSFIYQIILKIKKNRKEINLKFMILKIQFFFFFFNFLQLNSKIKNQIKNLIHNQVVKKILWVNFFPFLFTIF